MEIIKLIKIMKNDIKLILTYDFKNPLFKLNSKFCNGVTYQKN